MYQNKYGEIKNEKQTSISTGITFRSWGGFGTLKYMEELKQTYSLSGNFAQIATAKQHIKAKTLITEEMLEFKEMPAEYILPGTVVSFKDAEGKMAAGDIFAGEVILVENL